MGYGLKVGVGEPTAKMAAGAEAVEFPEACSDEEAHNMMASMLDEPSDKFAALPPINWLSLAMWIIKLLQKK